DVADHRDVPHWVLPVLRAVVEIVKTKRLVETRRVAIERDCQEHAVDVTHVVPSDLTRPVSEPVGILLIGRAQQQGSGVDGTARGHDNVCRVGLLRAIALDTYGSDFAA